MLFFTFLFFILFLIFLGSLPVGIIRPKTFNRFFKRTLKRKEILKIFGGGAILSFMIFAIITPTVEDNNVKVIENKQEQIEVENNNITDQGLAYETNSSKTLESEENNNDTQEGVVEGVNSEQNLEDESNNDSQTVQQVEESNETDVSISQSEIQTESQENTQSDINQNLYLVTSVTDGDTFKVDIDGTIETIRLIGIDTPETVDPRKSVECFGIEASNRAKELLIGKRVSLEADPTQGDRGIYGRLLRYVWLEDGTFFNKVMISDGYASEYTYSTPYKYRNEFVQAEEEAKNAKRGLWADDACVAITQPVSDDNQATEIPVVQSSGKYYTSSYRTSKYYYPEDCDGWKTLSENYLESYDSLEALLQVYPTKTLSSQCE